MLQYFSLGELDIRAYDFFNSLSLYAAILFNLFLYRHKKGLLSAFSRVLLLKKGGSGLTVFVIVETVLFSWIQFSIGGRCNGFWARLLGVGGNYFGLLYFSPFIFLLICSFFRVNPLKQLDILTPSYSFALIFVKLACLLQGCCRGKVCDFGLYFVVRDRYEFPSQLLEMITAFLLTLVMLHLLYRQHTPGSIFPYYLISYSSIRFFTEFTRDGTIVFLGLQSYQIQCVAGVVLGIFELFLVKKYGQTWSDEYDRRQAKYIEKKLFQHQNAK